MKTDCTPMPEADEQVTDSAYDLPAWPAGLPKPVVTLAYPPNTVETSIDIDGDTVRFWRWGSTGQVSNSADEGCYFQASDRPLASLRPDVRVAAINWGAAVHCRAEYALATMGETAKEPATAAAILRFVAGGPAVDSTPRGASVIRGNAALAISEGEVGSGDRQRVLFGLILDLRRTAQAEGLDLEAAVVESLAVFEQEAAQLV